MQHGKWFDRRFDAMPPERFATTVERLRGTPARLEEGVRGVATDALTRQADGTWSAQEHVGHLLDLEPLWLRRAEQLLGRETELVPADLANRRTFEARHNDRALADLLRDFRAARAMLVSRLQEASDATLSHTALHPRLRTPMSLTDLAHFVAEHDDHHLVAIGGLLSSGGQV